MNEADSRFINKLIPVKNSSPPEEFLFRLSGECGRWQMSICAVAFICMHIQNVNVNLLQLLTPSQINFTCADGNNTTDPCLTINGTKCHNFIFKKDHNMITFTEKFSLVCDRYYLVFWLNCSFIIGLIIGNVLVGIVADKYGRKIAALVFIPLQCLTGILVATSTTYEIICFVSFISAIFCSSIYLLSIVTVCDSVGNKWRTFALGFCLLPQTLSAVTLYYIPFLFKNVNGILAMFSLSPLPVLILLLYFKDSPMYILLSSDYEKAEEAFRNIAHFNKHPLSSDIRIRPVKMIANSEDHDGTPTLSYLKYFRSKQTRNSFFALLWLWFSCGACSSLSRTWSDVQMRPDNLIIFVPIWIIMTIIILILCHWIQHKKIICVVLFLTNICVLVALFLKSYSFHEHQHHPVIAILYFLCRGILWTAIITLTNLTPRMLPTGLRAQGFGVCLSVCYTGTLVLDSLAFFSHKALSIWVFAPFLLFVGPISQTYCCLLLWNVHNRELPDFVEDCILFERLDRSSQVTSWSNWNRGAYSDFLVFSSAVNGLTKLLLLLIHLMVLLISNSLLRHTKIVCRYQNNIKCALHK